MDHGANLGDDLVGVGVAVGEVVGDSVVGVLVGEDCIHDGVGQVGCLEERGAGVGLGLVDEVHVFEEDGVEGVDEVFGLIAEEPGAERVVESVDDGLEFDELGSGLEPKPAATTPRSTVPSPRVMPSWVPLVCSILSQ